MEEKEDELSSSQLLLNGWEPIQSQPQEAHAQSREWEMVEESRDNDDFSIFPPSNHEGLHPHLPSQQQQHGPPLPQPQPPPPQPLPPLDVVDAEGQPRREPLDSQLRIARDVVMKKLNLGFELISSKILHIASLVHSRRGANWSFVSGAGVTVAFILPLWYLRWQRWRRESREEKLDRLILLVRHQDQKIGQLLDEISRLHELLSTRRRIPILRSG